MLGNGCIIGPYVNSGTTKAPGIWSPLESMPRIARINSGGPIDTWPQTPDPNFSSVVALVHFDDQTPGLTNYGSAGAVHWDGMEPNNSFTKFNAVSGWNNPGANGSFSQAWGAPNAVAYAMGTGDFSLEFWIYPISIPAGGSNILDMRTAGTSVCPLITVSGAGAIAFFVNGANRITGASGSLSLVNWQFIQLIRSGGTSKLYVNASQVGSSFTDANNYGAGGWALGNSNTQNAPIGAAAINAMFAELRITKGVARPAALQTSRWPDY